MPSRTVTSQKLGPDVSTHFPCFSRLASPAVPVRRLTSKLPGVTGVRCSTGSPCVPQTSPSFKRAVVISDLGKRLCGY